MNEADEFAGHGVEFQRADGYESTVGNVDAPPVMTVVVSGRLRIALRGSDKSVSVHERSDVAGFIALTVTDGKSVLFMPYAARDARALAAGLLRGADLLDGGAGER